MKVAIPTWCGRVSPVFDVARRLVLLDVEGQTEISREETGIENTEPVLRVRRVAELGVNTLICGAISRPLENMLVAAGVGVIPHACGPVEEVFHAFLAGRLAEDAFLMPGCCGRRRQFRGRRRGGGARFNAQGGVA